MATRQQAGRFLEPPPLQSAGGHNMTLTNRMNKTADAMQAARTGQPAAKPAATQQQPTLRQRQQQQLRGLTNLPATKPEAKQQLRGLTNLPVAPPTAQMTQPEHNQLRERGNVPPVMAPSQGAATLPTQTPKPGTQGQAPQFGTPMLEKPVLGGGSWNAKPWAADVYSRNRRPSDLAARGMRSPYSDKTGKMTIHSSNPAVGRSNTLGYDAHGVSTTSSGPSPDRLPIGSRTQPEGTGMGTPFGRQKQR